MTSDPTGMREARGGVLVVGGGFAGGWSRGCAVRGARRLSARRTSCSLVATLGRYKGIADVMGIRLRGFPGWFVTRSYHLYQRHC